MRSDVWAMTCLLGSSEEGHQGQEEVDHIQVEGNGGPDILVIRVALDDVVRVIDDVPAEDEGRQYTVDHLRDLAQREQDLHVNKVTVSASIMQGNSVEVNSITSHGNHNDAAA
jgi:hypothetical protein